MSSIHIPAWAKEHEIFAAEELARYIKIASGAQLPVVRSLKGIRKNAIVLADLSCPAAPGLLPAKIGEGLKHDGFRLRTVKDVLYIVSARPGGVVFGAYEYLRRYVGCRFLDRDPRGENIPRVSDIRHASINVLDNSRIWYRGLQTLTESREELAGRVDWMAKNGITHLLVHLDKGIEAWEACRAWLMPELRKRGLRLALGHHIFSLLLPKEQFLAERPDFYAQIKGKRDAVGQLNWCMGNDALVETVASRVIQMVRDNPELDTIELWPDDGIAPVCECPDCKAIDDPRDAAQTDWAHVYGTHPYHKRGDKGKMRRYLHLGNRVAERLAAVYPKVRLNILAYADLNEAPVDIAVHPNIMICLAIYWRCARHNLFDAGCSINRHYQAAIRGWLERVPPQSLIFYDYYMGMGCWSSLPYPILTNLWNEWGTQAAFGMGGSHVQSVTGHLGVYGINYVAFSRLARENPPTLDEFFADYCNSFFGTAAGKHMEAVYRMWEGLMRRPGPHVRQSPALDAPKLFTAASVRECRKLVDKALAATDDPLYRWRIERIRSLVDYIQMWREVPKAYLSVRDAQRVGKKTRADVLEWIERMRQFMDEHIRLNDGLFYDNRADKMLRGWLEEI